MMTLAGPVAARIHDASWNVPPAETGRADIREVYQSEPEYHEALNIADNLYNKRSVGHVRFMGRVTWLTENILTKHWGAVTRVAKALKARRELSAKEIYALMDPKRDPRRVTTRLKQLKIEPTSKDAEIVRFEFDVELLHDEFVAFGKPFNAYFDRDPDFGDAKLNANLIATVNTIVAKIDACRKKWRGHDEFSGPCAYNTFDAQLLFLARMKRKLLSCMQWLNGEHAAKNKAIPAPRRFEKRKSRQMNGSHNDDGSLPVAIPASFPASRRTCDGEVRRSGSVHEASSVIPQGRRKIHATLRHGVSVPVQQSGERGYYSVRLLALICGVAFFVLSSVARANTQSLGSRQIIAMTKIDPASILKTVVINNAAPNIQPTLLIFGRSSTGAKNNDFLSFEPSSTFSHFQFGRDDICMLLVNDYCRRCKSWITTQIAIRFPSNVGCWQITSIKEDKIARQSFLVRSPWLDPAEQNSQVGALKDFCFTALTIDAVSGDTSQRNSGEDQEAS